MEIAEFRENLKGAKADADVFNPFSTWVDSLDRLNKQMASPPEKLKMEIDGLRGRLAVPEGAFTGVDAMEADEVIDPTQNRALVA